jgi:hypothetical protein
MIARRYTYAKAEAATLTIISLQEPQRVILEVRRGGKIWEIDVRIDADEDGGIVAEIGRDSVLCTSCEFGWNDRHDNEP